MFETSAVSVGTLDPPPDSIHLFAPMTPADPFVETAKHCVLTTSFTRSLCTIMYQAESLKVVLKLSIVLADAVKFLLFLTIANVSSDTVVATVSKLNVPAPSVTRACPADPSAVGSANAVPPDVIVSLEPSDSIFSFASVKCKPILVGIITSAAAVSFILLPVIIRSVPSPSIFSSSVPKVNPMFAGMLISPFAPTLIDMSVPSDSIFSAPAPSNTKPIDVGITTSNMTDANEYMMISGKTGQDGNTYPVSYTHLTLPTKRIV